MKPGEPYADVEQLIATGLDHYLQGRLREAATAFHEALWLDPANEQARLYLKTTLSTSGMPAPGPPTNPSIAETAWDAGESLQQDFIVEDTGVEPAPLLEHITRPAHAIPTPPPPDAHKRAEALLVEARGLEARGDFSGALERCEKLLSLEPANPEGRALHKTCVDTLLQMYESRLGPRDGVPEVVTRPDEMIWLNLDHRAGFVLAQIDGQVSYDDLYAVCGMSQLDTARLLSELLNQGIIRTRSARTAAGRTAR